MAACFTFASCTRARPSKRSVSVPPVAVMSASTTPVSPVSSSELPRKLPKPSDLNSQFSYTYGYLLFQALANQGFDNLDASYFAQGVMDARNENPLFTRAEMEETMRNVQQKLLNQARDEYEALAKKNEKLAESFFAQNGTKEGVVTMEDGIQYLIVNEGNLSMPKIGLHDTVAIDYTITKLDGTLIVSTSQRGHSEVCMVDTLASGFLKDGIQLLHPGAHYRFWVPYRLVEESGYLPQLEPNAAIAVDLEIKEVRYAEAAS